MLVWSSSSLSLVPGPAASTSPMSFLAMQIQGTHFDLLNQASEDGPETGLEQALLVIVSKIKLVVGDD